MAQSNSVRFILGGGDSGAFYCHLRSDKAALDHAAKVVKAGDVNAAAKSQVEFVREQIAVINDQQVELFDLTNAIAKDMAEAGTDAANAAAEQVKAAA